MCLPWNFRQPKLNMAPLVSKPILQFFFSFLLLCCFLLEYDGVCVAKLVHEHRPRKPEVTHLHFYFHDIVSGRNPTAMTIAGLRNSTFLTGFGDIVMMDDPLTEGPELSSRLIGKAQGLYASAGQQDLSLLMVVNYVFLEGKYNGSSLSILGRNNAMSRVREMPVVGGTGAFRWAHGYAVAKTHWFDPKTGDATVEYNVYVKYE